MQFSQRCQKMSQNVLKFSTQISKFFAKSFLFHRVNFSLIVSLYHQKAVLTTLSFYFVENLIRFKKSKFLQANSSKFSLGHVEFSSDNPAEKAAPKKPTLFTQLMTKSVKTLFSQKIHFSEKSSRHDQCSFDKAVKIFCQISEILRSNPKVIVRISFIPEKTI